MKTTPQVRQVLIASLLLVLLAGCATTAPETLTPVLPTLSPIPPTATLLPPTLNPISDALTQDALTAPVATPRPTDGHLAFKTASIAEIDEWLSELGQGELFHGAVLVAHQGEVVLSQGYGLADREQEIPHTHQSRFRIGSITKQFTAMAILILQAQGKLDVSDLICNYLEDCPAAWRDITIHHLLTHTAGILDTTDLSVERSVLATPSTPKQSMRYFTDLPLDFPPGEAYRYSNLGYLLLGIIIEQASGQSYDAFLQQSIFSPLNLRDTGYDHHSNGVVVGYANRYTNELADFVHMSIPFSFGGLYSTVEDLNQWDQALNTEQLLPQAQIDQMFAPHVAIPDSGGWAYGYGWFIGEERGRALQAHQGWIEGFRSIIARYPDEQITIIVLSNQDDMDVGLYQEIISKKIFGDR